MILGYMKLLVLGVGSDLNDLHSVKKRPRNRLQIIGSRDKENIGKIHRDFYIMIFKVAVLFRIQDLQQRGCRISLIVAADLVDLIQHHKRISHSGFLQAIYNPARHCSEVGAPVTADLSLIPHSAEGQPYILLIQSFGNRVSDRRLAGPRRSHKAEDWSRSVACQLSHSKELENSVLDLGQPIMIAVEDLLRADQVMPVAAGLIPGKGEKRLNVASENSTLRRLAGKILEAFNLLVQLILDFLRRLEFLSGLPEVIDIAQRRILAELLTYHFELLAQ